MITRETFWQIEGLLTLAKRQAAILRQIELSLQELCGEDDGGHCSDAPYGGYDAKTLLGKLGIAHPAIISFADDEDEDISDLSLSIRAINCLRNANINTVGKLRRTPVAELKRIKNFGSGCLLEVREELARRGIALK